MRWALARGWQVTGIDRDLSGVADLAANASAQLLAVDLEAGRPFPVNQRGFTAVVVTNYLWRPILPDIVAAVADDGILVYETFAAGNECYGRPSNPDFLLQPGELVAAVSPTLVPIAYEHVRLRSPDRIVQRIAAVGRAHAWLRRPPLFDSEATNELEPSP